jgi:hypothetical protein
MEALRAKRLTPNELGLPDLHALSQGFIPRPGIPARRIGAVETAPQRMEALRAGRLTPNELGLPDLHVLSRGFIPRPRPGVPRRRRANRCG